jgi:basic membrane lipoprotein Med (substrate-binding protein (PBP1-ABC) superfamily)
MFVKLRIAKTAKFLNAYRAGLTPFNREGLNIEIRKRKGGASG